ncbi:MAG: hypothetical protein ACP5IJ_02080 [Candidatus Nanoarchaeia archaeon]
MAKEVVEKKVKFFGHEIVLTFVGSLVITFGMLLMSFEIQPMLLTWLLATMFVWLGLLVFLFPIIRKIEKLL